MLNLPQLLYWIREREAIRERKELGLPKPWSTNYEMQRTYFCNVRREDDKTTRWIRTNWNVNGGMYEVAIIISRFFNKPETLEALGYPDTDWDPEAYIAPARRMMDAGEKVFSGAYLVSTHGRKMGKLDYLVEVFQWLKRHRYELALPLRNPATTLEKAHSILLSVEGLGPFMAAQVVADLKNTAWHPLALADDWFTWCSHGPGSLRGMAWLHGRTHVSPKDFNELMPRSLETVRKGIREIEKNWGHQLCAQDFQNCLCEFDKFMRVTKGTGRSKRSYNGTA